MTIRFTLTSINYFLILDSMLDSKLPPSQLLCSSCLSMVKNFDKFQSAAKAIRVEFNSLRSEGLADSDKSNRVKQIRFNSAETSHGKEKSAQGDSQIIDWDLDLEDATSFKSGNLSETSSDTDTECEMETTEFIETEKPRDDEMMHLKSEDDNVESLINFEFANAGASSRKPQPIPPPQRQINLSRSLKLAKLGTLAKTRYIAKSKMLTIISKPNDPKVEKIVKMFRPDTETAVTRKIPCEKCGKLFDEGKKLTFSYLLKNYKFSAL